MDLAQDYEPNRGNVCVDQLTNQIEMRVSNEAAIHVCAIIENMDHEYPRAKRLQALQISPLHAYKRRENPDAMASGVSVLHHFGAIRIEPRLGVAGKTNVDGSRYAGQTSPEIFKTKMLQRRDCSLPAGELVLWTI